MLCRLATVMSAVPEADSFPSSSSMVLSGYVLEQWRAACSTSSRLCARIRVWVAVPDRGLTRPMSWVKMTWAGQPLSRPLVFYGTERGIYGLATAGSQGHAQTLVAFLQGREHRLDAFLLVVTQRQGRRGGLGGMLGQPRGRAGSPRQTETQAQTQAQTGLPCYSCHGHSHPESRRNQPVHVGVDTMARTQSIPRSRRELTSKSSNKWRPEKHPGKMLDLAKSLGGLGRWEIPGRQRTDPLGSFGPIILCIFVQVGFLLFQSAGVRTYCRP
jgi:hypothetical protein